MNIARYRGIVNNLIPMPGGRLDVLFFGNTGTGADALIRSFAVQSDKKILVGGNFTTWNGTAINRLVRLNANGTIDTAFIGNVGTAANNNVESVVVQPDGKILVGGSFTLWNGTSVNGLVRLNSDGTRDTSFSITGGSSTSAIALQSDGKILVGGVFQTWGGTTVNHIVRLNTDGTRDTAFTTNTGTAGGSFGFVESIAVQTDGKIIVAGLFTTWNGATVNNLVRLNSNGTRDTAFTTNNGTGANSFARSVAIQSDGKILLGGFFTTWNGTTVNYVARLNSTGTLDTAFTTNTGSGANLSVYTVTTQADGKILVGGNFTTWNGTTVNRIVRLNSDGTRDVSFTNNTGTAANDYPYDIKVQADGRILVGGNFTTWNGTVVNRIVRLGGA